ncbi:MAG: hypothetical protein K0R73_603 [Candidatus Midichloriaceae bacterium]|nr:hypothetical protein [Candidatus Midichloriaceae bacterium]
MCKYCDISRDQFRKVCEIDSELIWKNAFVFNDFSDLPIDCFNGISGINSFPNIQRNAGSVIEIV